MHPELTDAQYSQLSEFVQALSERNSEILQARFHLSDVIIAEVYELAAYYFDASAVLSIPPKINGACARPSIMVYDTGDGDLAIDCDLLENEAPCEAYLHVRFEQDRLIYGYIKS